MIAASDVPYTVIAACPGGKGAEAWRRFASSDDHRYCHDAFCRTQGEAVEMPRSIRHRKTTEFPRAQSWCFKSCVIKADDADDCVWIVWPYHIAGSSLRYPASLVVSRVFDLQAVSLDLLDPIKQAIRASALCRYL